jgi:hypothetical protein
VRKEYTSICEWKWKEDMVEEPEIVICLVRILIMNLLIVSVLSVQNGFACCWKLQYSVQYCKTWVSWLPSCRPITTTSPCYRGEWLWGRSTTAPQTTAPYTQETNRYGDSTEALHNSENRPHLIWTVEAIPGSPCHLISLRKRPQFSTRCSNTPSCVVPHCPPISFQRFCSW